MADAGGIGSLLGGFSENFAAARKNKTLRQQMQLEHEDKIQQRQNQQKQFDEGMEFKRSQADALEKYRQGQQELQQKQLEIQKKTADVQVSGALMKVFDPSIPKPARGFLFGQIAKNMGIDPKSQEFKDTQKAFMAFDDEALDSMRKSLAAMMPDAQPGEVTAFAQSIISGNMTLPQLTEAMGQLSTRKSSEAIIDGLTGADSQAPGGGSSAPPASRLLSGQPIAQQPQGGNLPVPGMPSTAAPKPAAGDAKKTGMTPERARQAALKAFKVGNKELGSSMLSLARDLEGGGQQGVMGTIPAGYEVKVDPNTNEKTMVPIKGSPAATEAAAAADKEAGRKQLTKNSGNIIIQDIGRTMTDMGSIEEWDSGPVVAVKSKIPGSVYYNLNQNLDSIKANISFDALQKMRENSPTGGALGNVSDRDLTQLEKTKGNLDVTQRPEVLEDNLKRVSNMTKDIVYGTPEQISKFVKDGKITAEEALPLMERDKLSFDEFGKPIKEGKGKSVEEPTATTTEATDDTPKIGDEYTDPDNGKTYLLGKGNVWREVLK